MMFYFNHTVQTFNSCTGRQDVCQCLVVQTSMITKSKNKPNTPMIHIRNVACKCTFICEVIHASMPWKLWWQSGVRSCDMSRLPMHLVQELNFEHCTCMKPTTCRWLTGWPGRYINVQYCGGLSEVFLQIGTSCEEQGIPSFSGFYLVVIWPKAVESDVKPFRPTFFTKYVYKRIFRHPYGSGMVRDKNPAPIWYFFSNLSSSMTLWRSSQHLFH